MKKMSIRAVFFAIFTLVVQLVMVSPAISAPGNSQGSTNTNEQGSTNGQPFKTLSERIDIVSSNLSDAIAYLQQQIDELVVGQADQDTLIATLQGALGQLELRVLENETDIASLEGWQLLQDILIVALDTRITDLEARVTINEGDISAIILVDQAQQQAIDANLQQINLNNQLIVLNAGNITTLESQVITLQNNIDSLQIQITNTKGNVNTLQTQVVNLQNDITNLQIQIANNDGDINILENQVTNLQVDITNIQAELNDKQNRVLGVCSAGYSIRIIHADGTVTCEFDSVGAGVGVLVATAESGTITIPASVLTTQFATRTVTCPSTHKVSGGGHNISGSLGVGYIDESRPSGTNSWRVTAKNDSYLFSSTLRTYAQCLRVQ